MPFGRNFLGWSTLSVCFSQLLFLHELLVGLNYMINSGQDEASR